MGDAADEAREQWERGDYDEEDQARADVGHGHSVSFARRAPVEKPPVNVGVCRAIRESEKAIHVQRFLGTPPAWKPPVWVPKSHIDGASQVKKDGDEGSLIITAWIAGEKGWRGVDVPPLAPPRRVKTMELANIAFTFAEGAWTKEAFEAELKKMPGVAAVEIRYWHDHGDRTGAADWE